MKGHDDYLTRFDHLHLKEPDTMKTYPIDQQLIAEMKTELVIGSMITRDSHPHYFGAAGLLDSVSEMIGTMNSLLCEAEEGTRPAEDIAFAFEWGYFS